MTREEAIWVLEANKRLTADCGGNVEHYDMAIEALEAEPCADCVSRQAVIEMAYDLSEIDGEHFTEPRMVVDAEDIQNAPPVTTSQEADATQFAMWVAEEIFDDNWEYNKDAFEELACRKLEKLGIVRAKGDEWELVKPQESEDKE